jgi:hypothetical protein
MKTRVARIGTIAVSLLILTGTIGAVGGQLDREQSNWLTDYDQALAVARRSGRPIFVVFRCQH